MGFVWDLLDTLNYLPPYRTAQVVSGSMDPTVLKDVQVQLQLHLDTVYQDIMTQLETKWATKESLQQSQDRTRGNIDAILSAMKELDKRHNDTVAVR